MVPIGSMPILWHIMKIFAAQGHTDFILCLGYKGEMIKRFFREYPWQGSDVTLDLGQGKTIFHTQPEAVDWCVTLAETGEHSMTAWRLREAMKYLGDDEEFFITYGDGVGNVDVNACAAHHRASGKLLTLTAVHPAGRFGELELDANGACTGFNEKPQTEGGYISGGFMCARREVHAYLPADPMASFEQGPMQALVRAAQLGVYRHEGFWQPMDTYAEFVMLNRMWAEGKAPWKLW
jgi:glucose-1-phosphate cytidylyltransferase